MGVRGPKFCPFGSLKSATLRVQEVAVWEPGNSRFCPQKYQFGSPKSTSLGLQILIPGWNLLQDTLGRDEFGAWSSIPSSQQLIPPHFRG